MARAIWILASGLAAATLAQASPNIVLLFADDLGYGDLGAFGSPTIRTPNLDRLAAEGLRMTSFYSAPSCVPARTQLLLGRYPSRTRVGRTSVGGDGGMPSDLTTLAQGLKTAGYRTAMAGKWHLGYAKPELLPVGKGFDSWFGLPYSNDMIRPWVQTDEPLWLYRGAEPVEHPVDQDQLTMRYTEEVARVIHEASSGPFFAYLAYSMPHLPLRTAGRFRGRSRAGLYGDVIEAIDWSVGAILEQLERDGKADETIVIFTSDNGPWLNLPDRMLSGGVEPWHAGSPGPLRGAKHTTYEGGVRVPFIVRWPGTVPAGVVTAEMGATLDIYATLLTAAGVALPEGCDGHDLAGLWSGRTGQSPRREFLYHRGTSVQGVRVGPWKLRTVDGDELFQLDLDPSERYNVAADNPQIVAELRRRIEQFHAAGASPPPQE
ncbi:MAG: sulfatase [Bryobacterales bacterium]|nr:sulfatase [Bryobacterales bacterium]